MAEVLVNLRDGVLDSLAAAFILRLMLQRDKKDSLQPLPADSNRGTTFFPSPKQIVDVVLSN